MAALRDFVNWQIVTGDPIQAGDVTVTPESQSLVVRWPNGGLVWNRPVAVTVARGGQAERIPIVDVSRTVQLSLAWLSLMVAILVTLLSARGRRHSHGQ